MAHVDFNIVLNSSHSYKITTDYTHDTHMYMYRKISNIRRTKSPILDVSRLVVKLSSPNPMKPGVKSRMKM